MTDTDDLLARCLDRFDYVYGGDTSEYLNPEWRQYLTEALEPLTAEVERLQAENARLVGAINAGLPPALLRQAASAPSEGP